jgi:alanyl-tRNA synthetase
LADASGETVALHSATHLLLAWLRKYLWEWVHQRWSNITPERIRFDFSNEEKVEREILDKVEEFVNDAISSWFEVKIENMSKQEAKASWVEGSFWEKYPDIVKVYIFIWNDGTIYSRELCWWPHVESSKQLWKFKIIKEESSSRWVRRVKAVLEKI